MKAIRVAHHDMPYVEMGSGSALVAIHGSLGDFRSWSPVMGPLSRGHRLIVPSLRRFFPEHWDGKGSGFTIAEHTADAVAFIEGLGIGRVHLMGHSRGGHIAFRVAEQRPDLVEKLILAEPGGELDGSLMPPGQAASADRVESIHQAARLISRGDVDGGLELFVDRIYGKGTWSKRPAAAKQMRRDNAHTLIGQIHEERKPFTRGQAESIRVPALLIGGELTGGMLPVVLAALTSAIPDAKSVMIPNASHSMFEQAPVRFSEIVTGFLEAA
jgi:pimeloyl-ACP methyl ester carboxylesterase